MDSRSVVVDTDTASDDALAVLLLGLSDRAEIEAVTTVAGNVALDRATANAAHTLGVLGRGDVPIHEGRAEPLAKDSESAEDVHGPGGLGDVTADEDVRTADEGAVDRLCRADADVLLCIGPLTNVAAALERDPSLGTRFDEVVVMGGACNTLGNVTAPTEFNFWYDPDAAKRVLDELSVTLIDWGLSLRDGVLPGDLLDRVAEADSPQADFFSRASTAARAHARDQQDLDGGVFADALAATVVLAPDAVTGERLLYVAVDDREGMTRGYSLADERGVHDGEAKTTVVTDVDAECFRTAVEAALVDGDPDPTLSGEHHTPTLLRRARAAMEQSYAPYSEYRVGAALRTADGTVFTGCNVENSNYSNSLHAEELALGAAVAAGHREFDRLAVTSGKRDGITPCGMCRQSLAEFCDDDLVIVCDEGAETAEYTLGDLLPAAMGPETLA